jgi:hypothetical protein
LFGRIFIYVENDVLLKNTADEQQLREVLAKNVPLLDRNEPVDFNMDSCYPLALPAVGLSVQSTKGR